MNKIIKKKWIAALRSGKYRKAKKALHTNSGYCCLGVLCNIYKKETGNGKWVKIGGETKFNFVVDGTKEVGTLPAVVQLWSGLHRGNPTVLNDDSLAGLNDRNIKNNGKNFKEIAAIIEKEL